MEKRASAEKAIREIRRRARREFSAEDNMQIVIEGLRGEESIAWLCGREGIAANLYYRWSKEFLKAGNKRLVGDTQREASPVYGQSPAKLESVQVAEGTGCFRFVDR